MKILIFLLIFLHGLALGFLVTDYNKNRTLIEQNFILFVAIAFLLVGLAEWTFVSPSKGSTNEGNFKAAVNNEVQYFNKCKKENGHKVCEAGLGKEIIVNDF